MFIIADMEWVADESGKWYPTQLAAAKVDTEWSRTDTFSAFIRPRKAEKQDWSHMAYTGGTPSDFLSAGSLYKVLTDFMSWVADDNIIAWWHDEALSLFSMLLRAASIPNIPRMLYMREHIKAFMISKGINIYAPYYAADAVGLSPDHALMHYSPNDVDVICELLSALGYPQQELLSPPHRISGSALPKSAVLYPELPYQCHIPTKTVHVKDCDVINTDATDTIGIEFLITAIRRGYKPCSCCRREFHALRRSQLRIRNLSILKRTQFSYVYADGANIFHKPSCPLVLSANNLMGTVKYKTILNKGKIPCKRCNPGPSDEILPPSAKQATAAARLGESASAQVLSKEELRALNRHNTARNERTRRLSDDTLSESEKSDIYTLTQPGFAFWAAKGCKTFHLRSCSKLQRLTALEGFGTYQDAISSGYSPCRACKPSPKHNVMFSVPFTSCRREAESKEAIMLQCASFGYESISKGNDVFIVKTPVGKWRIYKKGIAVKLDHINFVLSPDAADYHEQPRLMLSYSDAIEYIYRHDSSLASRHAKYNKP